MEFQHAFSGTVGSTPTNPTPGEEAVEPDTRRIELLSVTQGDARYVNEGDAAEGDDWPNLTEVFEQALTDD